MSYNLVDPTTGDLTRVAGGTLYADSPIGTISPFGGSAIPSGYLLCNGAEVLKTAYAELYAVIGDAFGTASDNTKFKLPDLRGRATMGVASGHALGASENDATAVKGLSVATTVNSKTLEGSYKPYSPSGAGGDYSSVGNMTVSGIFGKGTASTTGYVPAVTATVGKSYPLTVDASHKHTASSTLSSTDTETRPKNVRVNYIIKAKQVAVPFDMAEYIRNQNVLGDYENVTLPVSSVPYDGVLIVSVSDGGYVSFSINARNFTVGSASGTSDTSEVALKKGDNVGFLEAGGTYVIYARYYKLRDYSGR